MQLRGKIVQLRGELTASRITCMYLYLEKKSYKDVVALLAVIPAEARASTDILIYTNVLSEYQHCLKQKTEQDINALCKIADIYERRDDFIEKFTAYLIQAYPRREFTPKLWEWCKLTCEKYTNYFPAEWNIKKIIISQFMANYCTRIKEMKFPPTGDALLEAAGNIRDFETWLGQPICDELLSAHILTYVRGLQPREHDPAAYFSIIYGIIDVVAKIMTDTSILSGTFAQFFRAYAEHDFGVRDLEIIIDYIYKVGARIRVEFDPGDFQAKLETFIKTYTDQVKSHINIIFAGDVFKIKQPRTSYIDKLIQIAHGAFDGFDSESESRNNIKCIIARYIVCAFYRAIVHTGHVVNFERISDQFLVLEQYLRVDHKQIFGDESFVREFMRTKNLIALGTYPLAPISSFVVEFKKFSGDSALFKKILELRDVPQRDALVRNFARFQ